MLREFIVLNGLGDASHLQLITTGNQLELIVKQALGKGRRWLPEDAVLPEAIVRYALE